MLDEFIGMFGHYHGLRDGNSVLLKHEHTQVWLSESQPYWLENVIFRYDLRIQAWQQREERFATAIHDF